MMGLMRMKINWQRPLVKYLGRDKDITNGCCMSGSGGEKPQNNCKPGNQAVHKCESGSGI